MRNLHMRYRIYDSCTADQDYRSVSQVSGGYLVHIHKMRMSWTKWLLKRIDRLVACLRRLGLRQRQRRRQGVAVEQRHRNAERADLALVRLPGSGEHCPPRHRHAL